MPEQPELDLPVPAQQPAQRKKRMAFAGFTRMQMLAGVLGLGVMVWGMWVTKTLTMPRQDNIVSARLSAIVGEYVQAQARSAAPPAQVEAEMRKFMASLEHELERRGSKGQIVLVGEAVLTRNVPDITDNLRQAVYASGVAQPRQASAAELQQLEQQAMMAAQGQGAIAPPPAAMGGGQPMAAAPVTQHVAPADSPPYTPPAATVSTFGGPDGNGGQ